MERRRFQRVQSYGAPLISLHLEASFANIVLCFIPFHPCIREGDPLIRSTNTAPGQRVRALTFCSVSIVSYTVFSPQTADAMHTGGRDGEGEERAKRGREGAREGGQGTTISPRE